jgi:putative ABC transport system ATP-binding protein
LSSIYALEDVRREFGSVRAVDGVSLTIEAGEHLAITGPSGSGKTTLLQLLGALDTPSGGELRFEGESLAGRDERSLTDLRLRRLSFVFQQFNLVPTLTARHNVEAALDPLRLPKRERRERALARLEEVGLANRSHHLPSQLSGGEQQRVAIARALANEPAVILADEPTGNLDRASAENVADLLDSLDRTVIVVTHDAELAARAPRIVRLSDGRVIDDVRGAGVTGLRAVELPVADVEAARAFYAAELGVDPEAVGLRLVASHPPSGGVTVAVDALRHREPLRDAWGNTVRFE